MNARVCSTVKTILMFGVLSCGAVSCATLREVEAPLEKPGLVKGLASKEVLDKAYSILLDADAVTTHHVEVDARPSILSWAFTVLYLGSERPAATFQGLAREAATTSGKIYGLMGLRHADEAEWKKVRYTLDPGDRYEERIFDIVREVRYLEKNSEIAEGQTLSLYLLLPLPMYEEVVKRNQGELTQPKQ